MTATHTTKAAAGYGPKTTNRRLIAIMGTPGPVPGTASP